MFAFVRLFGLPKAGAWSPWDEVWGSVGSWGYATLSEVYKNGTVRGVGWKDDEATILWDNREYPCPVLAFEDC